MFGYLKEKIQNSDDLNKIRFIFLAGKRSMVIGSSMSWKAAQNIIQGPSIFLVFLSARLTVTPSRWLPALQAIVWRQEDNQAQI